MRSHAAAVDNSANFYDNDKAPRNVIALLGDNLRQVLL